MTALLTDLGTLADAHPRAVFALATLLGCIGALSLAVGAAMWVAGRLAAEDERAEEV